MYMSLDKDNGKETEFNIVQEKIRRAKMEISSKLQELKSKKMLKKQQNHQPQNRNEKFQPLKTALVELKNAT